MGAVLQFCKRWQFGFLVRLLHHRGVREIGASLNVSIQREGIDLSIKGLMILSMLLITCVCKTGIIAFYKVTDIVFFIKLYIVD